MQGWVIVYLPGGDVYQMFDPGPGGSKSFSRKVVQHSLKAMLAFAQFYWWIKS